MYKKIHWPRCFKCDIECEPDTDCDRRFIPPSTGEPLCPDCFKDALIDYISSDSGLNEVAELLGVDISFVEDGYNG